MFKTTLADPSKVSKISDPVNMGYAIKYPIYSNSFNTRDYSSLQAILNDLEVIWKTTLQEKLNIEEKALKVRLDLYMIHIFC